MELETGYFTIERNLVGLTLQQMETRLGFRPGRLAHGARILVLQRQPFVGEFLFAGSTRYSGADGLVAKDRRRNVAIPHAWLGQRLVKVKPNLADALPGAYPTAQSPIEQWELVVPIPATEVWSQTDAHKPYWPNRR